jgi:hypothetical protein
VAKAEDRFPLGEFGNGALGVGADSGKGSDAIRHARLLLFVEGRRIKPDKDHLIESGTVPWLLCLRVERPGEDQWSSYLHIGGFNNLALLVADDEDELITLLRALAASRVLLLLRARWCGDRGQRRREAAA